MNKTRILVGVFALCGLAYLVLTPVPAQAQIQTVGTLKVFDANGKKVGKVLDAPASSNGYAVVAMKGNGIPFAVAVSNASPPFFGFMSALYFTVDDCGGTAYADASQLAGPMGVAFVDGPNSSVFVPDPSAVPETVTVLSLRSQGGSCQVSKTFTLLAVPVVSLGDLSPQFTPPFTVK